MIDLQPNRVMAWLYNTFAGNILFDIEERVLRFTEETLELGQTEGMTREQAHALVDQVFDKPVGEVEQEQGGVMVCLAAYAALKDADLHVAFEREMARIEEPAMAAKIRAKHAKKRVRSKEFA